MSEQNVTPIERTKSFIEKETEAIMARVAKQVTPATAHIKKMGEAAQKTTVAFEEMSRTTKKAKPVFVTEPRLTHRPFRAALANYFNQEK